MATATTKKPHKKTSDVWQYFIKSEAGDQGTCQLCNKTFKFSGNTTNYIEHLRNVHDKYPKRVKIKVEGDKGVAKARALKAIANSSTDSTDRNRQQQHDFYENLFAGTADAIGQDNKAGRMIIPLPSGRSEVWKRKLFGFYSDDGKTIADRQKAICTLCQAEIPYSGNTTNLGIHLAKRHPDQYLSMKAELEAAGMNAGVLKAPIKLPGQRTTIGSTVMSPQNNQPIVPLSRVGPRVLSITDAVATFLAQDLHSTTLVDGAGFHQLLFSLEPRYEPANLQDVQQALNHRRELTSAALQQRLSKIETCALTSDCWTAESGRSYCTLMARYIDADWTVHHHVLKTLEITPDQTHANHIWDVNKVLADWGLMPRIVYHQSMEAAAAVTLGDDGPDSMDEMDVEQGGVMMPAGDPVITVEINQMKVIAGLTNDNGNVALALKHLGMPILPCFAHLVNEAVCAGIGPSEASGVSDLISRARRLVNHFVRNTKDRFLLNRRCEEMGTMLGGSDNTGDGVVNQGELFADVPHRWVTTADMIGRLLEGKGPLNAVLMSHRDRNVRELGLTAEEWYQLEELYGALKAVAMAIDVLGSGDESASCAMVAPMLARLKEKFMKIREHDTPAVYQFKRVVWDHLTPHYESDSETVSLFNVSTLLDPRFKELSHLPEDQRDAMVQTARQMVMEMEEAHNQEQMLTGNAGAPQPAKKSHRMQEELDLLFGSAEDEVGDGEMAGTSVANSEIDKYLQEQAIEIKESPLDWWRRNWHRYGLLSKLARRHLCVPAVAVPSENILKQDASVFYSRRRRLQPDEVDGMIFLNKNIDLVME